MGSLTVKTILLIILAAAIVILFFTLIFQKKRRSKSVRSKYIDALYALIEGRKDDALQLLTLAVKNGETDIDAYIQLGILLREKGLPEKALQIHRGLTVRRDLSYSEEKSIQLAMAEDLADMGKADRAVLALNKINKTKKDPEIMLSLHRLYHRCEDYDSAYQVLKNLSSIDSRIGKEKKADYLSSVAYACMLKKQDKRADKYLEKALKEYDRSIPANFLTARMAMDRHEYGRASALWKKTIEIDISMFEEILPDLEKSLFESGNFSGLEEMLEDLYGKNRSDPVIAGSLASLYMKKGMLEESINILEEERKSSDEDPVIYLRLASAYLGSGRTVEARKTLDEFADRSVSGMVRKCGTCGERYYYPFKYCTKCFSFKNPVQ